MIIGILDAYKRQAIIIMALKKIGMRTFPLILWEQELPLC
jgi:hypothetical protein